MFQIQCFDNYHNMFDFYSHASSIVEAKNIIEKGIIYGLFKIIKTVDQYGHYKTIGYYEVNQSKAKKIK